MPLKIKLFIFIPAALLACAVLFYFWYPTDLRDLTPLEEIRTRLILSEAQKFQLAQIVREGLRNPGADLKFAIIDLFGGKTLVFLSVFLTGERPLFYTQSKPGPLSAGLAETITAMREDPRSGGAFRANADKVKIKVDLLSSLEKLAKKKRASAMEIETGLDGLVLQRKHDLVIQPPWDILMNDWEVSEGEGRQRRRIEEQLERLSNAAGRTGSGWRKANLYTFRTMSFIQYASGEPTQNLYRGVPLNKKDPNAEELKSALHEAANWIVRTTSDKGKFTYLYYPVDDETNFPLHYGIVRHAATVWGLFAANKVLGEADLARCAENGLAYSASVSGSPLFAPKVKSVRQNGISFLGATALGLMSLLEKPQETLTENEKTLAKQYADFLLHLQMEDGSFYGSYPARLLKIRPDEPPLYFPGESLLALVEYYQRTGDKIYLDAAKRAAKDQIRYFRKTNKPDAWCVHALSILATIDGDPDWTKGCFEMADYYIKHQWGSGPETPFPDYVGGFDNSTPPRATPAASRTEALVSAFELARRTNHPKAKIYGDGVLAACRFIMNNQYRDGNDYFLANPARARGGIRGGLVDNTIRVDYNQHTLIAFLGGLTVLADGNSE